MIELIAISNGSFGGTVITILEIIGIVTVGFRSASQIVEASASSGDVSSPAKIVLRGLSARNLFCF